MRLTLLTYGTRGDVQPYVALGMGLKQAGHAVRIAAPGPHESLVASHGLDFAPLAGDPAELSRALVDRAGSNPLGIVRAVGEFAIPLGVQVLAQARDACRDADAVVHSFLMTIAGHEVARERDVPDFSVQFFPIFSRTAAFPALMFPRLAASPAVNRWTHDLTHAVFWHGNRIAYQGVRHRHHELPALHGWPFSARDRRPPPLLYAFSPRVVPPPPDWGEGVHVTGYWFLDEHYQPPADLRAFLEAGPPPVYVGFGSVVTRDAARLGRAALDALALSGQRGVLYGGWSGLSSRELPETVFPVDGVPHAWLFPRAAAVVHHGGAGTTAAGLRAGVPSILTPFAADQFFWARRVEALGVGPRPIPGRRLTAEGLARAIRVAVGDGAMRARAAALGEAIRAEDGVGAAVEIIQRYLAG